MADRVNSHPSIKSNEFFGKCLIIVESAPKTTVARINMTTNPANEPPIILLVRCRLNFVEIPNNTPTDKNASRNSRKEMIKTGNMREL